MFHKTRPIDLGKGGVGVLVLKLALPAVLAQVINLLYNLVDRMYVSALPEGESTLAIAGLGVVFPITLIVSAFANLVGLGGAPLASIALGERKEGEASRVFNAGVALLGLFGAGLPLPDSLAVGAGFGYYSLATVIITQLGDPALGSVALLSNMIHEIITLTLSPLLVRVVGRLGPVMAGGAAAMDTCLPIIARYSGERYAILAVFSGMTLTLLVPVLVPALMSFR